MTYDIDDPVGRVHPVVGCVGDTLMAMVQIKRETPLVRRGLSFYGGNPMSNTYIIKHLSNNYI